MDQAGALYPSRAPKWKRTDGAQPARYASHVIKSLLVVLLLLVLAARAALSRPSEQSFENWYRAKREPPKQNVIEKIFNGDPVDHYLKECTYKNRIFWAEVDYKGEPTYTGVFSHWWGTLPVAKK